MGGMRGGRGLEIGHLVLVGGNGVCFTAGYDLAGVGGSVRCLLFSSRFGVLYDGQGRCQALWPYGSGNCPRWVMG